MFPPRDSLSALRSSGLTLPPTQLGQPPFLMDKPPAREAGPGTCLFRNRSLPRRHSSLLSRTRAPDSGGSLRSRWPPAPHHCPKSGVGKLMHYLRIFGPVDPTATKLDRAREGQVGAGAGMRVRRQTQSLSTGHCEAARGGGGSHDPSGAGSTCSCATQESHQPL